MLSKKTKYGLKALIYLSRLPRGETALISQIAAAETISKKFLESILLELKKKGVLSSKMGKGGGYYLMKPPDQITIASIYRILEGPIALLPCVSLNYYQSCEDCSDEESCALRKMMIEVRDNNLKVFENKTLADFI